MVLKFSRILISIWLAVFMPVAAYAQVQSTPNELSQKAVSMKITGLTPIQGLITNCADVERPAGAAKMLNNLQMLRYGIWTNKGIGNVVTALIGTAAPLEIHAYESTTQTGVIAAHASGAMVYGDATGVPLPSSFVSIGSIPTGGIPCIRQFGTANAYAVCSGANGPYKWDGNTAHTFGALPGWPLSFATRSYKQPQFMELFANRVVYAGFSTFPNTILISDFGNAETFTQSTPQLDTDAGAIDVPRELGSITGLATLKLTNTTNDTVLLIGCTKGFAILNGTGALTFAVVECTKEFGVKSNRTWITVNNDIYFVATDGIRKFSSISTGSVLSTGAISYPISNLLPAANVADFAVRHGSTKEIHFYMGGNGVDTSRVLDFIMNYASPPDNATNGGIQGQVFSTKTGFIPPTCGLDYNGYMLTSGLLAGAPFAYLFQEYSGNTFVNDATGSLGQPATLPIPFTYVSAMVGANNDAENCSCRKFEFQTDGTQQHFTVEAYTLTQQNDGTTLFKLADSAVIAQASPVAVPDLTLYSGSGTTTKYPKFIPFMPRGSGRYWLLRVKGTTVDDTIDLEGITAFLTVGGLKQ